MTRIATTRAAGARPSTSCRSMRIDIRPCGVSDGSIFDLHGYMLNGNIRNPPPTAAHRARPGRKMVSECRPWPGPVVLGIGDDARGQRPRPAEFCKRGRDGDAARRRARPSRTEGSSSPS